MTKFEIAYIVSVAIGGTFGILAALYGTLWICSLFI